MVIGGDRDAKVCNTIQTEENLGNVTTQTHMQSTYTCVKMQTQRKTGDDKTNKAHDWVIEKIRDSQYEIEEEEEEEKAFV